MQSTRPISKNCEDPTSPFVLVFDLETGKLDYLRGAEFTEFSSLFEQRYGQLQKSDDALSEDEDTKEADKADTRSGHPTQCYCLQCNPWTDEEWELAMLTHPSVDLSIALRNARSHLDRRRRYLEWVRNGKPCVAEINVLEYSEWTPTTSQKESSQEAWASGSRAEKGLELTKAEPIVMFIQDAFAQRISYDDIFGRCCDENVTKVVVEDPYIVGTHATGTRNFEAFCRILSKKSANLKTIELKTRPELEEIVRPLAVKILARHKIGVVFTPYDQHPRIF